MAHVFVYGTLKRGFPLWEKGLLGATFIGLCQTARPYPLMIAQDFYGPIMLDRPGEGLVVRGELFDVPEGDLPRLDELESVGSKGSFRSSLEVEPVGGGVRQQVIGFMKDESWLHPVQSDHLSDYQDRRFIPPWNR